MASSRGARSRESTAIEPTSPHNMNRSKFTRQTLAATIQSGSFSVNSPAALAGTAKVAVSAGGSFNFTGANDAQTFPTPLALAGSGNDSGAFFTCVEGSSLTWSGPIKLIGATTLEACAANSTVNLSGVIGDLGGNSDVTFFTSGAGTTHKDCFVLSGASLKTCPPRGSCFHTCRACAPGTGRRSLGNGAGGWESRG